MRLEDRIPADWTRLLQEIQQRYPEAVIAGGALRDLDQDRPVKDIDIFVKATDLSELMIYIHTVTGRVVRPLIVPEYVGGSEAFADVIAVFEFTPSYTEADQFPNVPTIQIIVVDADVSLERAVFRFDLGLCAIAFNGQRLFKTRAYETDHAYKTMTVVRSECPDQMLRTLDRVVRLRAKYPDYALVIPPEFMDLLAACGWRTEDLQHLMRREDRAA